MPVRAPICAPVQGRPPPLRFWAQVYDRIIRRAAFSTPRPVISPQKDEAMKYMIEYTVRNTGLSHDQNLDNFAALLKVFGKWTPDDGLEIHAFVGNLSNGGYVLVEAADPGVVSSFVSKFTAWNDVEVVPVIDIAEVVGHGAEALSWDRAALSD
jgi:hypothetical protein